LYYLIPFPVSLESDRERIVEQLSAHYAEDHLSTQDLEVRFERAYRAKSTAELEQVLTGLPSLAAPARVPAPIPRASRPSLAATSPGGERSYRAIMSNFRKSGNWTPSRVTKLTAFMAGVQLDLRDATFVDSEIEFDITAIMTEVKILVPPGVTVECDGSAFMGEFSARQDSTMNDPDAPVVRVTGSAFMATVVVETRLPGESRLAARRRERLQRGRG
jgi:hypothetical protein